MQVALGRSASDEICHAIFKASKMLHGDDELLIACMPKEEVEKVSSLSQIPLFSYLPLVKATWKDLHCIHLFLGFPVYLLLLFQNASFGYHYSFVQNFQGLQALQYKRL
uniref:Uncharacterized protein n=1 Tax=Brassica campestris TaxID=3711 RepID=M4CRN9_BRACM